MKSLYKLIIIGFLVLILVLSGCVKEEIKNKGAEDGETENEEGKNGETENGGSTGAEMSFTTVTISDEPIDNFSHINVTFSEVKVHKAGNDNDSGWIIFDMETKTIDMLYLHNNNVSEVLGVMNLTAGNYTKLWVIVDSATGVLNETGEEITFDVPSGDLKYQQSFEIKEGNTTIDVELDLGESVLYVPQGGVAKLKPTPGKMKINNEEKEDDDEDEESEQLEVNAGNEYEAKVNETITFEGKAEGGIEPYKWSWDFGDGNTSIEQNPTHAYNETGTYTATLTVEDDEGNIATDTATVTIEEED